MTRFDRPILVVGNARSGTTLLRTYLERCPSLWRLGRESRFLWSRLTHPFDPARGRLREAEGDPSRLDASGAEEILDCYRQACFLPGDEGPDRSVRLVERIAGQGLNPWYYDLSPEWLKARQGAAPVGPPGGCETGETPPFTCCWPGRSPGLEDLSRGLRLLDKDTGHVYRLPLLRRLFPEARFLFVCRDPRSAISSLIEAWKHPRWFFSYRVPCALKIAGYSDQYPWGGSWWNLNLPPDWRALSERPLEEVAARTWASGMRAVLEHLPALSAEGRALLVRYEDLVADPGRVLREVAELVDIDLEDLQPEREAPAMVTEVPPSPTKWHRHSARIESVAGHFGELQQRLGYPD